MPGNGPQILVIEDSDVKWREIQRVLNDTNLFLGKIVRAATVEEANRDIGSERWDLILLDISMDIRTSSSGRGAGGHDATGGLKIAERMFYLGHDAPIIIVTAFDAFPSGAGRRGAVLGLQDVIEEASTLLGELLVGWVRYGDDAWDKALVEKIRGVLAST